MTEKEHPASEHELTPEDEKKYAALIEALSDTVAGIESLLSPGDRFALRAENFGDVPQFDFDVTAASSLAARGGAEATSMDQLAADVVDTEVDEVAAANRVILAAALRELGVTTQGLTTVRESGKEKWYATGRPELLLGTDGTDWWIEIANS